MVKDITRDENRRLVVVDPRATETAKRADLHLAIRPGGDVYLLLAMAAIIVREELYDGPFVEAKTEGFGRVAKALEAVDVEDMAKRAGLEADAVRDLARGFAKAKSASMLYDLGVEQVPFSTLIAYLIRLVLALTGNYAQAGDTLRRDVRAIRQDVRQQASLRGAGHRHPGHPALGGFGMFSPSLLPEEIEHDHPERIRALIVEGANPLLTAADTTAQRRAFEKLDLLVVIDPAMTETARAADYVLPAPVGYEKWEWSSFPNGYPEVFAQVRPPVVPAVGEALPEPEIYARLAEAMGRRPGHAVLPHGARPCRSPRDRGPALPRRADGPRQPRNEGIAGRSRRG